MRQTTFTRLTLAASVVASLAGAAAAQNEWMAKINLAELHKRATGVGISVGQMEDGYAQWGHVALNGKNLNQRSVPGPGAGDKHATHVASIIAGRKTAAGGDFTGAAPNATLQASHWVDPAGAPSWEDDFLAAMKWFRTAPRPQLINMSASSRYTDPLNERQRVQWAADWVASTGILYVTSAGNLGRNGASTLGSPSSGFNTLTVGATGETGALKNYDRLADYSGLGPTTLDGARMKPDLVAPGSRIYSATEVGRAGPGGTTIYDNYADNDFPGGNFVSGTSFSTPIVSGVAACLFQWGNAKGLSTDSRVMRSVLMNSTTKSVRTGAGDETRWDRTAGLGKGANSISTSLGTGQLDALQAWEQYRAGEHDVPQGGIGEVPNLGFDLNSVGNAGLLAGNAYLTNTNVRKGSYMTSTVAWNRDVNVGNDDWTDWSYKDHNNIDIAISKFGSINTIIQQSNNVDSTTEHSVFKATESARYHTNVFMPNAPVGDATYSHAWEWFSAPTYTKEFNGNFSGTRGHYLDNGWYNPESSSVPGVNIVKPAFVPNNEEAWALCLSSSNLVSQQVAVPFTTFTISFDFAFDGNNGTFFTATLGGMNIFSFDADPNSSAFQPNPATNVNRYQRYTATINDPAFFQGFMLSDGILDLTFITAGGPDRLYIDNITFVPTPGVFALACAGLTLTARRRRAA